jgi:hypothetical protein
MSRQICPLQCKNLRAREAKQILNTHMESDSAFEDLLKVMHESVTMSGRIRWQDAHSLC